ncbi:hypothetical protein OGAPHI_000898 [Ogataea philodendri]|uniref:Cytochrome c domain-containing protein n=1 Tax=Ogataea philodendri TaxID=1378263 RepID=A0A9P8T8L0_9ASCO|nr:uncharacterized protein OGAPHI_000898 [Ogataea philodendri]KAH3670383.1 hypothetical protein OGAPHI_000898 [Ogataea philodendri]
MSGTTPEAIEANIEPARPIPVWASSTIKSIPRSSHWCFISFRYPSGRTSIPPDDKTGSKITAAREPTEEASTKDHPWAVTGSTRLVGTRICISCHSMPGQGESNYLKLSGVGLGKLNSTLVRFRSRAEKDRSIQPFRCQCRQFGSKINNWRTQHTRKDVIQIVSIIGNYFPNFLVAMSNQTGHLTRGEVKNLFTFISVDV